MDREAFDSLMTRLDTAMVVLTASGGAERSGCLVGFHTQCGIEPLRCAIWVSQANHTHGVARRAGHVAVHLLADGDRDIAEWFGSLTGDEVDKFAGIEWEAGPGGVPLLARCPNRFVASVVERIGGGDHTCLIVEPAAAWTADHFVPLRFSSIDDIEPGHAAG
jgi:flavin reductase (DIM6/NTAB) family NADH-FMN oxidoreductase RutF